MATIIVSPGHTQEFPGVRKNGFNEFEIVSKIAKYLHEYLVQEEVDVELLNGTLLDKVVSINKTKPRIAIEIHLGNSNNSNIRGVRSFYKPSSLLSRKLAGHFVDRCASDLNIPKVGYYAGWYKKITPSMVNNGKAPADWVPKIDIFLAKLDDPIIPVIVEPLFLSSSKDCSEFIKDDKLQLIAKSLLNGLVDFISNMDSYVDSANTKSAA